MPHTSVASVDYATADGTATPGLKYTPTSGTLTFGAGEINKSIDVPILNEGIVEGLKSFAITLSNPTNAVLGAPATATVSIHDVDVGMQFQFENYNAASGWPPAEDVGTVLIGIVRGDDNRTAVIRYVSVAVKTVQTWATYNGETASVKATICLFIMFFMSRVLGCLVPANLRTVRTGCVGRVANV